MQAAFAALEEGAAPPEPHDAPGGAHPLPALTPLPPRDTYSVAAISPRDPSPGSDVETHAPSTEKLDAGVVHGGGGAGGGALVPGAYPAMVRARNLRRRKQGLGSW